jgi:hypothetical protein
MSEPFLALISDVSRWIMLSFIVIITAFAVLMLLARIFLRDHFKWVEGGVFSLLLTIPGLFGFLAGLWIMVGDRGKNWPLGLMLAGGGWLAMFAGICLDEARAKARRARWPVVPARCLVHELQERKFAVEGGAASGWVWRVNCEFDYAGRHYRVEPRVHWISETIHHEAPFWSEKKARRFMEGRISSTGECKLRVKPDNPQEAELVG